MVPGLSLNVTRSSCGGLKTTPSREHITIFDHIVAFCFALGFEFFDRKPHSVDQAGLEYTIKFSLISHWWWSSCLSFQIDKRTDLNNHTQLYSRMVK